MAYYAYLDKNNIVVAVTVGKDETELINGLDTETYYALGTPYTVKRTSLRSARKYAGIGYSYNSVADVFVAPQPYPSWSLDANHDWQPPTPMPTEGKWNWNEETLSWDELD